MSRFPRRVTLSHRLFSPLTEATVACAQAQVPTLVRAGNRLDSIVVINNGVDVREFFPDPVAGQEFRQRAGIPRTAKAIGLVGGHRVEKRQDRFIRLVEAVNDMGVDAWGCMVGGGPLLDVNRRTALRSPACARLVFAGPVVDMRSVYNAMDLIVLVSDTETFPLCFLEAQACARPVVGPDTGGVGETFLPGRSGVLVAASDEAEFAQEVADLLRDNDRARAMGDYGQAWVTDHLSLDKMVDGYEALLERTAGRQMVTPDLRGL